MRAEAGPERGRPLVVRSAGGATPAPIAKRVTRTAVRPTALPVAEREPRPTRERL